MMKILFANVNHPHLYVENQKGFLKNIGRAKPNPLLGQSMNYLILEYLTPKEHIVTIREWFRFEDINLFNDHDLIGLSFTTQHANEAYKIADEFKRQGKIVIIGGWHASALPKEAKQHADSVVIGEAEETWPQLLKDLKNNKLKPFYEPERPVETQFIPELRYDDIAGPAGVQATRGCPYGCKFCSVTYSKHRNVLRKRSIEQVVNEIKSIDKKYVVFYYNSLTIDIEYTKELFRALKNVDKYFTGNGNINTLGKDDELLRLAQDAGFLSWFIGFESVSPETLKEMSKKTNKVADYKKAVKKIHDYNMHVTGSFVFGFDNDTKNTFNETYDAIQFIEIDIPYVTILTPFPGTPLFDRLDKENRILSKDWAKYTFRDVVYKPKNMTPEELLINTEELHDKLYTYPQMIKRSAKGLRQGLVHSSIIKRVNFQYKDGFKNKI